MFNKQDGVHNFIKNVSKADSAEIQGYLSEIEGNNEFHNSLKENQTNYDSKRFSGWGWGIGSTLGKVLYALCRKIRPDIVVETGVASGVSSSYILCSLEENKNSTLYSIDLARQEGQCGWIIPKNLRDRWQLIMGRSSEELPSLLDRLKVIDTFLHDSEYTYQNMFFEYQAGWKHLRPGGLLLSHNIDTNDAFSDFCRNVRLKCYEFKELGGLSKV
ncbi:class I SAM-dependent methyltransferase [Chloroflexota bacterium]